MLAFGGASNCWWASTPRMIPADFELHSRFGVGRDWPVRYDDLEEHYCRVEEVMSVAGPADTPFTPRSRPYVQPPHRLSEPDRLLQRAYPDLFFPLPTARASRPTALRPACCGNGVCGACPIDAKFTIVNELASLYRDPRVTLLLETRADAVELAGDVAQGVRFSRAGRETVALGDLVVLAPTESSTHTSCSGPDFAIPRSGAAWWSKSASTSWSISMGWTTSREAPAVPAQGTCSIRTKGAPTGPRHSW